MSDVFGKKTEKKSSTGNSLYEFDRVSVRYNGRNVTGTILNVCDPWYPEFKILIDSYAWANPYKPEWTELNDGEAVLLLRTDKYFRIHRTSADFINYCKTYDYRSQKNNTMEKAE